MNPLDFRNTSLGYRIALVAVIALALGCVADEESDEHDGGQEQDQSSSPDNGYSDPDIEAPTISGNILILEDSGTEQGVHSILDEAGFDDVVLGGHYGDFDGENLENFETVIFLNGTHWSSTMDESSQQQLRDWIGDGGGLLSTEWLMWSGSANETFTSTFPVTYGGSWSRGSETYTRETGHPIAYGLPDSFDTPSDWSYSETVLDDDPAKEAVTVFSGSSSGAAVAAGRYGDGRIVHWNMGGEYNGSDIWSEHTELLLTNIVAYLADDG